MTNKITFMKKIKNLLVLLSITVITSGCSQTTFSPKNGDIIFHTSKSNQSKMISEITKSKLTHVGIIFINKGKPYVFEAVQPVKITPLNQWIKRGVSTKYIVMRSKKILSNDELLSMKSYGEKQIGKDYDIKFQWSNNKMYCSELVYKIYEEADIKLCSKHTFKQYNLNSESAKNAIKKRYGNNINLNETVVTPVDLRKSNKLKVVFDNY